jgi:creatinine amidohydrolase
MDVVSDVVESLYEQGIPRVAVLTDLGGANESLVLPRGNYIVKTAVRQLNYAHPNNQTIWVQPFTAAGADFLGIFDSAHEEIQAGEVETSCLMAAYPQLVKASPDDALPLLSREYLDYLPFESISPGGVWGRPTLASAEKGQRALDAAVARTCEYIEETFRLLEELKGHVRLRAGAL